MLALAAENGNAYDFQDRGVVDALGDLIHSGRIKLYCVDTDDLAPRAEFQAWILDQVVPYIQRDTGGDIIVLGPSMGAFHALSFALYRADVFPVVIGLSGNYGVGGDLDYVPQLHGDHLEWLRSRLSVLLVCGQGQWEDTTGALDSTRWMAGVLADKGIRCELDLWGHDVPHDWPSWGAQLAYHLPRFC